MKINVLQITWVGASLLIPVALAVSGTEPSAALAKTSGMMARVTLLDGTTQTVKLEGVGCSNSICSRRGIKSNGKGGLIVSTLFADLTAIKDTSEDAAIFVMKDGAEHRRTLLKDFRVLYVWTQSGEIEKLDLAKIKSVEFAAQR